MTRNKTLAFLFGSAIGMAVTAVFIGLVLAGIAVVSVLKAGGDASLLRHPLYESGTDLVFSGLLVGLMLYATRYFWRRP